MCKVLFQYLLLKIKYTWTIKSTGSEKYNLYELRKTNRYIDN